MRYTQQQVDELRAAIATGAQTVSFSDGRTVTYRSQHEMYAALNMMERSLGSQPVMHVNARYSSGL